MRAKPLLTFGLVAGALVIAPSALALGLGKLTVDSALGQPLSARIELTSATRDELDTLSAKIADPSLYRQNNLTYQGVLSRTRVTVESSGGTPFLRITSPVAVAEPFLDLMVELNWAAGRVVREYTFLLDPPGTAAPAEPTRIVRMQAADWRNYRNRVAASAPAAEGAGSRAAGGAIGAVAGEATPAAPPGRDQLKVSPSTGATKAAEDLAAARKREG